MIELYSIAAVLGGLGILAGGILWFRASRSKSEKASAPSFDTPAAKPSEPTPTETKPPAGENYHAKLASTRGVFLTKIGKLLKKDFSKGVVGAEWDEVEEALLSGDVGVATTQKILEAVKNQLQEGKELQGLLRVATESLLDGPPHGSPFGEGTGNSSALPKPYVISIVGVNGAGKTTTTGKLAKHFMDSGKKVLLGAVDTFRAGAIAQLRVWSERTGADFVTGREGGDPGAVAFDSVTAGKARGVDIVLLDTAGRLHTKDNLMEELKKIHRVVKKVIPEAPHERWLVIDGTAGQNSMRQAKEFHEALNLTGIIVTKLDGSAKGGVVFSIVSEMGLPIRYIGLGESAEDLIPFSPKPFVDAVLGA